MVKYTVVNGKILVKDGVINTINTEIIGNHAHSLAEALVNKERTLSLDKNIGNCIS